MVLVRCYKCGYVWDYRGKKRWITCPNCARKIDREKALVRENTNIEEVNIEVTPRELSVYLTRLLYSIVIEKEQIDEKLIKLLIKLCRKITGIDPLQDKYINTKLDTIITYLLKKRKEKKTTRKKKNSEILF